LIASRAWEFLFEIILSTHAQGKLWRGFKRCLWLVISRARQIFIIDERASFGFTETDMHALVSSFWCILIGSWRLVWPHWPVFPRHGEAWVYTGNAFKIRVIICRPWSSLQIFDNNFTTNTKPFAMA